MAIRPYKFCENGEYHNHSFPNGAINGVQLSTNRGRLEIVVLTGPNQGGHTVTFYNGTSINDEVLLPLIAPKYDPTGSQVYHVDMDYDKLFMVTSSNQVKVTVSWTEA